MLLCSFWSCAAVAEVVLLWAMLQIRQIEPVHNFQVAEILTKLPEAHQVMVECSFWYCAATANVVLPQAMLRMCHPLSSWKGLGYMVLSPLALSLPHAHSWGPTMQQKLLVLPAATCAGICG